MQMPAPLSRLACSITIMTLAGAASAQWTGEWPMDSTAGTTAVDISGNMNDGTLMNFGATPWVAGMFGNALSFDGVDDYVAPAFQASIYDGLGSPYSIAYWVKAPPQLNAFVYGEGSLSTIAILIFGSGQYMSAWDKFRVYCRNDQGNVPFTGVSNAVVYDGTWHHIAFVDVSGRITLYVDGVIDSSNIAYDPTRLPGSPGHGTFSLSTSSMGALRRGTLCCHMTGEVDDLRLYRFAMSGSDVLLAMAGAPVLPPSGSIGEYGVGCGAGPFDIAGGGSAVLGGPGLQLQLQAGSPGAFAFLVGGLGPVAPLGLTPLGYTGCTLYPGNFVTAFVGLLDATGALPPVPFAIPNNSSLAATQLNLQGASLGSTLEFTDVVIATLGF